VWYFLGQHRNLCGDIVGALKACDLAIEHTPTVIDTFVVKGQIMKQHGAPYNGSNLTEEGRKMDLADRYLNTVSVRALLAADRNATADSVVTLFTKDGENPNNLFDMQCMWFEIKYGNA
jgi:hypothetical protein